MNFWKSLFQNKPFIARSMYYKNGHYRIFRFVFFFTNTVYKDREKNGQKIWYQQLRIMDLILEDTLQQTSQVLWKQWSYLKPPDKTIMQNLQLTTLL